MYLYEIINSIKNRNFKAMQMYITMMFTNSSEIDTVKLIMNYKNTDKVNTVKTVCIYTLLINVCNV